LLSPTGPNASVLEGTIYFWTHNTPIAANQYIATDYAMYNLTGGTGTGTAGGGTGNSTVPDGKIAAGQGFFIKGQTSGTVIFNNSMRIVGNNDLFFRSSTPESVPQSVEKHRIWLELTNSYGAYKQTLVGYIETATNELDTSFDGEVMESGNVISLYSFANIHKLGIQGRALPFEITDEVPLGYRSDIAGSFNIALSDYDGLFVSDDINIYLEDKLLNVFHNLKNGAYAFTTNAGTFDHRFVLRYSSESLDVPSDNYSNFVVYRNGAGINIYSPQLAISEVKIYDLRGRLLLNVDGFDRNEIIITNLSAASQVLLVQVKTSDSKIYNRKIVF
nr:T9SS type A sorting domain-containing protein [Flavobacterium sp.]